MKIYYETIELSRHSGESRNPGQWRSWAAWMLKQVRLKFKCPGSRIESGITAKTKAQSMYVLGVSYDWPKEFMPFKTYEHRDFENPNSKDYDQFQLGFQLKF